MGLKLRYSSGTKVIHTRRKNFGSMEKALSWKPAYMQVSDLLGNSYQYRKAILSLSQNFRLPRWGKVSYRFWNAKAVRGDLSAEDKS